MDRGSYTKNLNEEKFCESKTIAESQSETIKPVGRNGPFIVRMPVVISQSRVHIHIESRIKLDQPVADIRNCKRDVYLTGCKLLDTGNKRSGKIYLDGYIKESLEYAAIADVNEERIRGDVRHLTVKAPFECTAKVEYYLPPAIKGGTGLLSVELSESGRGTEESFSARYGERAAGQPCGIKRAERLYCEVEEVQVEEMDMVKTRTFFGKDGIDERMFDAVVEQLSVSITFTLLQNQLVNIPKAYPRNEQYYGYF